MLTNKILKVISIVLGICFVVSLGLGHDMEGSVLSATMLILLTTLYYRSPKPKSIYFTLFLIVFTLANVVSAMSWFLPEVQKDDIDYYYYFINTLYIISYILLIIRVLSALKLKLVFKKFLISIIVLIILDIFCVFVITDTTSAALFSHQLIMELLYNTVVMILLSVGLINYMYRNDNKSMLFLMASICIVFYEIIQLAYFYVLSTNNIGVIYSTFLVLGLVLLYSQSQMKFMEPFEFYSEDQLEP